MNTGHIYLLEVYFIAKPPQLFIEEHKQVARRATMLTWEPLYKARKNGNIKFLDA